MLLTTGQGWATLPAAGPHPIGLIEVFTTSDQVIAGIQDLKSDWADSAATLTVYAVDGIARFERALSEQLPGAPGPAQRLVAQRLARLDQAASRQLQLAATGLAKAAQYGVDRLPAIVIDGRWVVYGLTDVRAALEHLHAWQAGRRP